MTCEARVHEKENNKKRERAREDERTTGSVTLTDPIRQTIPPQKKKKAVLLRGRVVFQGTLDQHEFSARVSGAGTVVSRQNSRGGSGSGGRGNEHQKNVVDGFDE